jgi:hypothetical protein
MAQLSINVQRVNGKRANADGELLDEYDRTRLEWKEPGFVYCFIDASDRGLGGSLRSGWRICDAKRDFIDRGCPPEILERMPVQANGQIRMHDVVLAKMPAVNKARINQQRAERRRTKRRSYIDSVHVEADKVASAMKQKNVNLPEGGLVFEERASL